MMNRLLIINHYWPPTGGPCVQRWVDFSSYLVKNGFEVSVLTPENPGFPFNDETLLERVDSNIKVYKVGYQNRVSGALKHVGNNWVTRFVRGNFFLPDPRMNWNKHAIEFIENNLQKFDVLITAGPPHSTHFIGLHFKDKLKWIADFHDYWSYAINYYLKQFNRLWPAQQVDMWLEKKILKNADAIFVHCQTAVNHYQKKTNKPIHIIPMGFYDALFEGEPLPVEEKVISHVGSFFSHYKIAFPTIKKLQAEGYTFRQIGPVDEGVAFPGETVIIPYVPHKKAIEYMRSSGQLLLVNHQDFLPGKIFEYLGAMRPIIAISPKGSDAEILVSENKGKSKDALFTDFSRTGIAKKVAGIIKSL